MFEEVVAKYNEMLMQKYYKAHSALENLKKQFSSNLNITISKKRIILEADNYRMIFKNLLYTKNCLIVKTPLVRHKEIINRCLQKKRPFKKNDSGYKDFLIWKTLLDIIKKSSDKKITFITADYNDFYDNDRIHQD